MGELAPTGALDQLLDLGVPGDVRGAQRTAGRLCPGNDRLQYGRSIGSRRTNGMAA